MSTETSAPPARDAERAAVAAAPPLVVDLDGTLVATDTLVESALLFVAAEPLRIPSLLRWAGEGPAPLKRRLADHVAIDPAALPYREDVLAHVRLARAEGRTTVLATAAHETIARAVANHLGVFDHVLATGAGENLKGENKLRAIRALLGTDDFDYIGESTADRPMWAATGRALVVATSPATASALAETTRVERRFDLMAPDLRLALRAMRIHQWLKNLLIFVPLVASHTALEPGRLFAAILAFVSFGLCASSTYIVNDLLDLPSDRRHAKKRQRPIASGQLDVFIALRLAAGLMVAGLGIAFLLVKAAFAALVMTYVVITLTYSLYFKRKLLVDVFVLAGFYAFRVASGALAISVPVSEWLLAFCLFLFLSLAFVKRYTELHATKESTASGRVGGRGYFREDIDMVRTMGVAAGYAAIVVIALYIQDPLTLNLYPNPRFLWVGAGALLYWLSRVWFLAQRGYINEDPVLFAARDRISQGVGGIVLASVVLASLPIA